MIEHNYSYPTYAKIIHLGIAVFGVTAFLTGELAEGRSTSLGYLLHAYLGLSLAAFMIGRMMTGFATHKRACAERWVPFSLQQWQMALEDFRTLLRFQVPERDRHQGLAGLTQAFGLAVFSWMAITGTGLYFLAGGKENKVFKAIEEGHEVGESLIPLYLAMHVGAVILHTLSGNPIWKRMFSTK